ncbi:MAG TPA: PQQ-dependent sugar dehydrogenase, partial [Gammaproteobacteria bacterium]
MLRHHAGNALARTFLAASMLFAGVSAAMATEYDTSFEFTDDDGFSVGEAPLTADFANGSAEARGMPSLYSSGQYSWFISPGETGIITFSTPAFDAVLNFKGEQSAVRAYDAEDNLLDSATGTSAFQEFALSRAYGEAGIARIEVENLSTEDVAVDDFSFQAEENGNLIAEDIATGDIAIELEEVASGFAALPLQGLVSPVGGDLLYIVDQVGQIYELDLATGQTRVFADVSARLVAINADYDERGLLGMAFHPDYQANGLVYTYTSEAVNGTADFSTLGVGDTADHQSVITEWTVNAPTDASATVDAGSARELLRIDQPQFNHNGGALAFDADGNLYITLGDGGAADDQGDGHSAGGNGQDSDNVLGSVLRIDPLGTDSANGQYGIPAGNPFVGTAPPDEIFATGLRNPFRIHVDTELGDIWLPDVGQNDIEEINQLSAGANYGWNWKEGSFFFNPNGTDDGFATELVNPAAPDNLTDPVAEYDHSEGIALIGGAVYHGSEVPALDGMYVFGDYAGNASEGRLFYLDEETVFEFDMAPLDAILTGFG